MKRNHLRIEPQNEESDGEVTPSAKKVRNYTTALNLLVTAAAKAPGSTHSAGNHFRDDRKRVKDWMKQEIDLQNLKIAYEMSSSHRSSTQENIRSTVVNLNISHPNDSSEENFEIVTVEESDVEDDILQMVEEIEVYRKDLQADLEAKEWEHEKFQESGQIKKAEVVCNKIFDLYNEIRAVDAFLAKRKSKNQIASSQYAFLEIKGTGLASLDEMLTEFMRSLSNGYYGLPSAEDVHDMLETLRKSSDKSDLEQIIKSRGGEKNFIRDTVEMMLQLKKDNFTISMLADNLFREFGAPGEVLEPPIVLSPVRQSQNPSVSAIKKAVQYAVAQDQSYLAEADINDTEDLTLLDDEGDEEIGANFLADEAVDPEDSFDTTVKPTAELELTISVAGKGSQAYEPILKDLEKTPERDGTERRQDDSSKVSKNRAKTPSQPLEDCDTTISDLEGNDEDCDDSSDLMIVSRKIVEKLRQEFCERKSGITVYGLPRTVEDERKKIEVVDLSISSREHFKEYSDYEDSCEDEVEVTFSTF